MDIPFLDLKAQYQSIKEEIDKKVIEVIASQRFILGSEVEHLEKEVALYCGTKHAVGVSSGSDALIASLMALGVGDGDEVVTTPFTFFATAGAITRLGARPVFCDIDRESYNISPQGLEEILENRATSDQESRIKVIIPVHLYGQCAEMEPIMELAEKYSLFVIEDAAQAIGSEYPASEGAKRACTMGDLGMLSFFPSKNLSCFGDGGMVLTDDEKLAERLRMLRIHGSRDKYFYETVGGNFRLDALQAGVLRVKLKHLDDWLEGRKEKASYYDKRFADSGLVEEGWIFPPKALYRNRGLKNYHTYHQYVVRAKQRDDLQKFLKERGIPTAIYYPLSLHLQKCFAYLGYKEGDFPESEEASREILALPIYPELSSHQQDVIVSSINQFYKKG
jgi:dTDP-4-amino-4,6-dideoxygalactose transaminase